MSVPIASNSMSQRYNYLTRNIIREESVEKKSGMLQRKGTRGRSGVEELVNSSGS